MRKFMGVMAAFSIVWTVCAVGAAPPDKAGETSESQEEAGAERASLPSVEEARGRAELLHEAMHATLQFVHHQYFREDEGLVIPALTLERVFRELADRQHVELRWLAVNAQAMNVDHKPADEFEKAAARALAAGKEGYERVKNGVYRRAGAIVLGSDCLKCHLSRRTSNEARLAGLVIAIPVEKE